MEHEVAVEVAGIAATPGRIQDRARAMLEPLQRVMPFQGSAVMLLDPDVRDHTLLAWGGIDAPAQAAFQTEETGVVVERSGVVRSPAVVRVRELPMPLEEIGIWRDHLVPAGFREGIGLGLHTPDNRYLGALTLLFDDPRHAPDAACRSLEQLSPMIAHAIDPMRRIAEMARIVRDAHAGVILTRSGLTTPLGDMPGHPLLRPRSAVLITAGRRLGGAQRTVFLCPYRGVDGNLGHVRVTALSCPPQPVPHLWAIVVLSAPRYLEGLTPRELAILGLLIGGWPDWRIAAWLRLDERQMTENFLEITAKLHAPDRAIAISRAARLGLYVPRPMIDPRRITF